MPGKSTGFVAATEGPSIFLIIDEPGDFEVASDDSVLFDDSCFVGSFVESLNELFVEHDTTTPALNEMSSEMNSDPRRFVMSNSINQVCKTTLA